MGYDQAFHEDIQEAEEGHPWFEARADLVSDLLGRRLAGVPSPRILDLGCGTGLVASRLSASIPGSFVVAVDLSVSAASRVRNAVHVVAADLHTPPFRGGFDAVLLLDVIEHFRDDGRILGTAGSLLRPGGTLVITVPAMRSLWSGFDELSGHERRYGLRDLVRSISGAGLDTVFSSYFMSFMPLPLLARRRLAGSGWRTSKRDALRREMSVGGTLSMLFRIIARLERAVLLSGLRLPPGSSAVAMAVRDEPDEHGA